MSPGIVLAAGAGTRFGEPKAPIEIDGERLVDRAVRVLREAGCDPVFVILGAWEGAVPDSLVIVNHGWEEGMASSLRIGLKWARATTEADNAIVTLVDLPGLTPEAVRRIDVAPPGIAIATYDGERGHPVRIPREHWEELIATVSGDTGARDFFSGRDDVIFVEVGDVADGTDLDTPND
jgi:CTP:molybdopterin cytidylyltransferase MocA